MKPPLFIAELSCNHRGSIGKAYRLIEAAARAGADAVKFQTWDPDCMVLDRAYVLPDGPWKGRTLVELYEEAWTPWDWYPNLIQCAKDNGIEWFSTPFDHPSLAFLESYNCPRYKVSSFEIVDLPLIRSITTTGKPVVISTGMATLDEITAAMAECAGNDVTLLKCTSAYPAAVSDANLATMLDMRNTYLSLGTPDVGLSDHTMGHTVAVAATALGATMIEKHFCLARSDGGPDAAFSMEPKEFGEMVSACQQTAEAIGEVQYGPSPEEMPQHALRRSCFMARAVKAGQIITAEDLTTARPGTGVSICHMRHLMGRPAARDLQRGDPPRVIPKPKPE